MPDMTCIYTLIGRNEHLFYKIQLKEKFLHYYSIQSPCIQASQALILQNTAIWAPQ